jgi:ABC-2 type transport system permease protein
MRAVAFFVRKEFRQLRRDPRMLMLVLVAPVIQLILLGYAANLDVEDVPVVVYDGDKSAESRELVDSLTAGEQFRLEGAVSRYGNVDAALDRGEARLALVIPDDFGADLAGGEGTAVQLLVDGTDSVTATIAVNAAEATVKRFAMEAAAGTEAGGGTAAARSGQPVGTVEVRPQVRYNPELETRNFMVPGIVAMLLMIITMILTSLAIVKEKEAGTLEQLNVSPLKPLQLLLGKLIPFVVIGFVDVIFVLLVVRLLFGITLAGSGPLLLALSGVFILTTLGLGLFVSTVSQNQQQAMMVAFFFVMLPMFFLSGFAFPIENMPQAIQLVTYLLPLRYFFVVIRGIFLKGVGMPVLWDETVALLVFGLVIMAASALRFRKRLK